MNQQFQNVVYQLNEPVEEVSTEILRSELKALRHAWMIHLRLGHEIAHASLMECIKDVESELKSRKKQAS